MCSRRQINWSNFALDFLVARTIIRDNSPILLSLTPCDDYSHFTPIVTHYSRAFSLLSVLIRMAYVISFYRQLLYKKQLRSTTDSRFSTFPTALRIEISLEFQRFNVRLSHLFHLCVYTTAVFRESIAMQLL